MFELSLRLKRNFLFKPDDDNTSEANIKLG